MLDRALPQAAPFTAENTRIIAVGLSNGGGAVLQAAGLDEECMLAGAVALAPNVSVPAFDTSRALYDYATEAALWLPCALTHASFDATPFARVQGHVPPAWIARCASLHEAGVLDAADARAQAAEALERLRASGWSDAALACAASSTVFDLWRSLAATYASSYLRAGVGNMPCGFRFDSHDATGNARGPTPAERAAWWSDSSGIPPGAGVFLDETIPGDPSDPALRGLLCLRELWTGEGAEADTLRASVAAAAAQLPRKDLPLWIIHGREDGLVPDAFNSAAYVAWLRASGRNPIYWSIPHAQHFDAFLALPGFGDHYVPLLPYGYSALDRMWRHLVDGVPLIASDTPAANPRGAGKLDAAHLALPAT
jgi:hydroxybutyrate-dimer hydrolase